VLGTPLSGAAGPSKGGKVGGAARETRRSRDPKRYMSFHAGHPPVETKTPLAVHIRLMEYLLQDKLDALRASLAVALFVNTAVCATAATPAKGLKAFRAAAVVSAAANALDFIALSRDAGINLAANGLDETFETARSLANSPACKYAFFALFFLIRGPTNLCLAPVVFREAAWTLWTVRDAFRWMESGVDQGSLAVVNRVRSIAGSAASVLLFAPQFQDLTDEDQEEVLGRRLFQVNVVLEAIIGLRLLSSPDFPSKVHRVLALYVYFRIVVAGLNQRPQAMAMDPLGLLRSLGRKDDGDRRRGGEEDDEEDEDEEDEDEEEEQEVGNGEGTDRDDEDMDNEEEEGGQGEE